MPLLNQETGGSFSLWEVFRGTLLGLVVSLLGSALIGICYYLTSMSEHSLPWFSAGLFFVSVLAGAWSAASRAGNRGLFHGLGVAVLFFLLSWLLAATILPIQVSFVPLIHKLLLSLVAGALGGVLGVGSSG